MKQHCEICLSGDNVAVFHFGGQRPGYGYRVPDMDLCEECLKTAAQLLADRRIVFRPDHRDTTNSRYSRIKAGVKRARFGNPNINARAFLQQRMVQAKVDLETEVWL